MTTFRILLPIAALALGLAAPLAATPAAAQGAKPGASGGGALAGVGSSKEPISIDADRLDVFDKEGRAVFSGNVIAVQGDTNMRCTEMNVLYESKRAEKGEPGAAASPAPTGGLPTDSSIRKIECKGPVTIKTKTQTATGDRAEFDRVVNKVFLIGNAALSDGTNVMKGERVAYDLNTGVANVVGGGGGRVRALIVPGAEKDKPKPR
ncbi:LptA/OstA family protein [Enterovirga rhinocerotis]|uniref:Lipopolysaccharide export system protein LptA n=1 Tax=Enterovirga rhinocerotis TaxID=1339210 RepID=A0A4R7BYN9_9HYPH|nr:LptA/OstA family protein [Enterovirga rhinocerotis]TDR89875.1 lipopolysaccharide export system protein LptA [Enterovirga rhinocerotis]